MGELEDLHDEVENLRRALATRDVIGQAKGILMERHSIDAEEAFVRLRRYSQHSNTKLHQVAARIAGAEPPEAEASPPRRRWTEPVPILPVRRRGVGADPDGEVV